MILSIKKAPVSHKIVTGCRTMSSLSKTGLGNTNSWKAGSTALGDSEIQLGRAATCTFLATARASLRFNVGQTEVMRPTSKQEKYSLFYFLFSFLHRWWKRSGRRRRFYRTGTKSKRQKGWGKHSLVCQYEFIPQSRVGDRQKRNRS